MKAKHTKLLVVYEDDNQQLADVSRVLEGALAGSALRLRTASAMTISELLAASFYVFCVQDQDAGCWQELKRVAQGINLAGREACMVAGSAAAAAFSAVFTDSELAFDDNVYSRADQVVAWCRQRGL